jgi:hypothetical protein
MKDAGIFDGDRVIIDRAVEPHNGSIVVAFWNGEFTIKYLDLTHKSEGYIELRSANPDYPVFKIEAGDGAMAYIDVAQFNLNYRYYDEENKKDTLGVTQFASTEEVVQATHFDNENLERLLNVKDATYLKSPAGIFTLATLPTDQINVNDTINSAKLVFTRYNDQVSSNFKLSIPKKLLLVRLDDYLNGFFENYSLTDNATSYLTSFSSSTNTYSFNNISRLISRIQQEKRNGTATENVDKVLLIPVEATYDSSNNLVKLSHDFSMSSAKLVGGTDPVKLEVIYSRYK